MIITSLQLHFTSIAQQTPAIDNHTCSLKALKINQMAKFHIWLNWNISHQKHITHQKSTSHTGMKSFLISGTPLWLKLKMQKKDRIRSWNQFLGFCENIISLTVLSNSESFKTNVKVFGHILSGRVEELNTTCQPLKLVRNSNIILNLSCKANNWMFNKIVFVFFIQLTWPYGPGILP